MKDSLEEALSKFEDALREADLHPKVKEDASRAMRKLVNAFEAEPDHRAQGGGRVRKKPRKRAVLTVNQATQAATTIERAPQTAKTLQDHPAKKHARDVLKSLRTLRDFREAEKALSTFVGKRNKASHRRNVREAKKKEVTRTIDGCLSVRRLRTSESLRTVGRKLKLCVAGYRTRYHRRLRDGSLEFWELLREGESFGLLSINPRRRTVEECDGRDHEPMGLDKSSLLKILQELNASGDYCDVFVESGAYRLFLDNPDLTPDLVKSGGDTYEVWGKPGTVVIRTNERLYWHLHWTLENGLEVGYSEMEDESLLYAILTCQDLRDAIAKHFEAESSNSPGSLYHQRPRFPRRQRRPPRHRP